MEVITMLSPTWHREESNGELNSYLVVVVLLIIIKNISRMCHTNIIRRIFANSMKKVLFLCTGNSCRSQMAEAYLQSLDSTMVVRSAGTNPCNVINPYAVRVMAEDGFDLSTHTTQNVTDYLPEPWDYVITVCENARETCPHFMGTVGQQLHIGFDDPAEAIGTDEEIMAIFRKIRDQIKAEIKSFYLFHIKQDHETV